MTVSRASEPAAQAGGATDFVRVVMRPEAVDLVVAFSAVDAPSTHFAIAERRLSRERSYVLVRGDNAFQSGVPGLGNTIDDMIVGLRNVVREAAVDRCVVVGEGAGGYAALLIGGLLAETDFVAFSPYVRVARATREQGVLPSHPFWGDLTVALRDHPPRLTGLQFHSPWTPEGAFALATLGDGCPALGYALEVACLGPVYQHLARSVKGYDPLKPALDQFEEFRRTRTALPVFSNGAAGDYMQFHDLHLALVTRRKDIDLVRVASRRADWKNPGWQRLRGNALRISGQKAEALDAYRFGHELIPEEPAIAFDLGRLAVESGETRLAGHMLDVLVGLQSAQTRKSSYAEKLRAMISP